MLIAQVDFSHVRVINKETLFNKKKLASIVSSLQYIAFGLARRSVMSFQDEVEEFIPLW